LASRWFFENQPNQGTLLVSVINGVLAPFLLVGILIASCNRSLIKKQPSYWFSRIMVALTAAIMFVAAGAMFVS
jgi:Mn2+/Fe2+ NRAMP family transporter